MRGLRANHIRIYYNIIAHKTMEVLERILEHRARMRRVLIISLLIFFNFSFIPQNWNYCKINCSVTSLISKENIIQVFSPCHGIFHSILILECLSSKAWFEDTHSMTHPPPPCSTKGIILTHWARVLSWWLKICVSVGRHRTSAPATDQHSSPSSGLMLSSGSLSGASHTGSSAVCG